MALNTGLLFELINIPTPCTALQAVPQQADTQQARFFGQNGLLDLMSIDV